MMLSRTVDVKLFLTFFILVLFLRSNVLKIDRFVIKNNMSLKTAL